MRYVRTVAVETYVSVDGWGCDFCFVMRCFVRPLGVSVTSADSILSTFEAVTKPFDPNFTTSFMPSLREFLPAFYVLFAYFRPLLGWMYSLFVSYRSFALICSYLRSFWSVFAQFPLIPALSGVSVHSLNNFVVSRRFSDSCDCYNYVPSGCVLFSHSESWHIK